MRRRGRPRVYKVKLKIYVWAKKDLASFFDDFFFCHQIWFRRYNRDVFYKFFINKVMVKDILLNLKYMDLTKTWKLYIADHKKKKDD